MARGESALGYKIDFDAFRGVDVLVTGHTGFKGAWLAQVLKLAGAKVSGLSLAAPENSLHAHLSTEPSTDGIVDIRNLSEVRHYLRDTNPSLVFHLAAQSLVRRSYDDPVATFSTNVMGAANLLEAVRSQPSVRGVVFITSDKAYENVEWEWGYRETDSIGGSDPYSASKGAAEIILSSFRRSFFSAGPITVAARAGNVIGGGDWSENRIVPDIVRACMESKKLVLRHPNSTRPWQHVLEPLSGYLLLGAMMISSKNTLREAYNFGPSPGEPFTVRDVSLAISRELGTKLTLEESAEKSFHEASLLRLSIDRAQTELGWYPRWDFHQTMHETGSWYRRVWDGEDPAEVTNGQILKYFGELSS